MKSAEFLIPALALPGGSILKNSCNKEPKEEDVKTGTVVGVVTIEDVARAAKKAEKAAAGRHAARDLRSTESASL